MLLRDSYLGLCPLADKVSSDSWIPFSFSLRQKDSDSPMYLLLSVNHSGFGITVGVHRLWSHRSYEAALPVRVFLMLCNSIANQGSIFHWARDHRVHHKYTETDADPHNATRGFFFAHMGWLFIKKHPDVVKAGREMDFSDLKEDSCVMFQKKLDPWFTLYMCFVMPAQVASHFWGEDFWTAFFVAGCLRYCIVLHFTWLVNSAAHLYGDHPYDVVSYPAENPIVSWCSVGEGMLILCALPGWLLFVYIRERFI